MRHPRTASVWTWRIPDAQFGPSKIGRMRSAVAADRVRY
jgi:hypothetical protein